jgi:hypothetical protein
VAEADHALSTGRGGFAVGSLLYNGAAFTMTRSLVLPDVTEFRHDNPFDNLTSIGRRLVVRRTTDAPLTRHVQNDATRLMR